jgi:hypothetical protein
VKCSRTREYPKGINGAKITQWLCCAGRWGFQKAAFMQGARVRPHGGTGAMRAWKWKPKLPTTGRAAPTARYGYNATLLGMGFLRVLAGSNAPVKNGDTLQTKT